MERSLEKWLLLGALSLGWGSAYLFQKESVSEVGALTVTAVRLAIAAVLLYLLMRVRGHALPRDRSSWIFFVAIGFVGNIVPFALVTWAQQSVKSSVAGILTAIVPLFTLLLAHYFGSERMNWRRVGGFIVGFAGVVVLFGPQAISEGDVGGEQLFAYIALLAAALGFAIAAIVSGRMPEMPPSTAACGVLTSAAIVIVPVAVIMGEGLPDRPTLDATGSLAVLALIITPWSTYAYFRLVRLSGPAFLSLFNYFNPLVAVAAGVLVLGERLPSTAVFSLLLILVGVALSEYRRLVEAVDVAAGK